jgi:hypothetical protein
MGKRYNQVMNHRKHLFGLISGLLLFSSLAQASDMTPLLPMLCAPVMVIGFVLAFALIGNQASFMKTGHLVVVALLLVALVMCTLVALVCLSYLTSRHATIAWVYLAAYGLFVWAAVAGFQAFRKIPVHPDDQPPQ